MYVKAARVVLNPSRYKTRCDAILCNSNIIDRCMEEVKLYSIVLKLEKASKEMFSDFFCDTFYFALFLCSIFLYIQNATQKLKYV